MVQQLQIVTEELHDAENEQFTEVRVGKARVRLRKQVLETFNAPLLRSVDCCSGDSQRHVQLERVDPDISPPGDRSI